MHWHGRRVVVTGADGFIGSHLVERLVEAGAQVTALSLYNSFNHWGWLEEIPCLGEVRVITGDIRDPHLCDELLRGAELFSTWRRSFPSRTATAHAGELLSRRTSRAR